VRSNVSLAHSLKPSAEVTALVNLEARHRCSCFARHRYDPSLPQKVAKWSGLAQGTKPEACQPLDDAAELACAQAWRLEVFAGEQSCAQTQEV
jgi:hypothetical protein